MTPRATYRLQFNAGFRFRDAAALVPYLQSLGISHVYASPYLRARAGSTHGYDIVDHNAFNPEIGTPEEYRAFVDALRAHGMGHILDFVPNHMGVGGCDNAWWLDLLMWGRESHYADYFDVDWEPLRAQLRDKILLPFLGGQYGDVLEAGELHWDASDGAIVLRYFEHCLPLAPPTYALVLDGAEPASLASFGPLFAALGGMSDHIERRDAAASLRRLLAETEDANLRAHLAQLDERRTTPEGKALLDRVVEAQHWRPASWKVAAEEINYRRFFDINGLAALRMEHAATFADAHKLVFELIGSGDIDGLRLDHVDGLYDPLGYCDLLRSRAELLGEPLYLVIEKILAPHELLRDRWNVDGTTGYEFMNAVTGLFIDSGNEAQFSRIYERFTGDTTPFENAAFDAKRFVLITALAAERNVLALRLDRIAQRDPHTRDFTLFELTRAIVNTIAAFPIYRTYVRGEEIDAEDRRHVEWAIAVARARDGASEGSVYAFLRRILLTETGGDEAAREHAVDFAMHFQQLTSPVAAKGVEDTAFYRWVRFAALNEVGGDPGRFGTSTEEFHRQNATRAARRPHAMVTTSTHDAKRGEDVRARLAVLSEIPDAWRRATARWSRLNARHATTLENGRAPSPVAEYTLYQTLVGAWPIELLEAEPQPAAWDAFVERLVAYMVKGAREAKLRTSWIGPDEAYERALERFVRRALDPRGNRTFVSRAREFVRTLAPGALANGLAQTVLRAAAPGVPDTYQGAEWWELTLVDPDNRRPVDFEARAAALRAIDAAAQSGSRAEFARELLAGWHDGRIKQYVLASLLRHRAAAAWPDDAYAALRASGARARHAVAFARGQAVVVVPRLPYTLGGGELPLGAVWGDTEVSVPGGADAYRDVLTGRTVATRREGPDAVLPLAEMLAVMPVAVLEPA